MIGKCTISHWARGQPVIAHSSGEAEFYSMVSVISEMLAARSLARDLNVLLQLSAITDAAAAIGMAARRGLGRARRIATCFLWIQDRIRSERIQVKKRNTMEQLADFFTKIVPRERLEKLMQNMGFEYRGQEHILRLKA